jgi:hypothetical protein
MRRHINVFVNGERAEQETAVEAGDRIDVLPGDLRRAQMTEVLVGTKKGCSCSRASPAPATR